MKLRLTGTEAECATLTFLLRYGPPDLEVVQVSPPYANRGDSHLVRVYLEARVLDVNPLVDRTFYSLQDQDGNPLLVDAWGNPVRGAASRAHHLRDRRVSTAHRHRPGMPGLRGSRRHRRAVPDADRPGPGAAGRRVLPRLRRLRQRRACRLRRPHAGLDDAGPWDDAEFDEDEPNEDACPSCQGSEWNPVQGFPPDPGPDDEIKVLRAPCGCTTARARVRTVVAEQEGREP